MNKGRENIRHEKAGVFSCFAMVLEESQLAKNKYSVYYTIKSVMIPRRHYRVRLAILGGSFNPIHYGHLFLADAVLSELHYDRVVMVPAFISPFKPDMPPAWKTARAIAWR